MKLKHIILQTILMAGATWSLTSCNDFLDMAPLDQVTPQEYFNTTDHLAAYSISQYNSIFSTHGGYGVGTVNNDQNTDNMVAGGYSSTYFEKDQWRVPNTGGGWDFTQIRYCNYFFENVLPKFEAGKIEGNREQILHYVGEMYFIRAWIYYSKLKSFGDFPIITEVLPDDQSVLIEKSVRQPRNLVARFIINQLDSAAKYMVDDISGNKTRLTKNCALLIKSRVALYEATFEKYHKGTGRVPGDATWPGKRIHTDFSTNMDNEINFFLDEAMKAAEQVADDITLTNNTGLTNPKNISGIVGWNPYFEMFAEEDMSSYSEVLFWKQYMNGSGVSITHGTPAYIFSGGNNGMLKSFVDCFVMEDGLPYYAAGNEYKGDKTIMDVKENRDLRLQMFVLGEKDLLPSNSTEEPALEEFKQPNIISLEAQTSDNTGYRIRKCLTYNNKQIISGQSQSTTGCIIFRGVEAYLNYLEAYYLRNNKVDGKAKSYWDAVRNRAGITGSFQTTIDNTDMNKETDLAAHPGSYEVDATLYNIRRERRCEFIGEGMRWDDLVRWRAWDGILTNKFIPEGYNFWEEAYKTYELPEDVTLKDDPDDATSNISSREFKYVRPFSKVRINNQVYDGYSWAKANYLSPVAINEMRLASPDNSTDNSVIYQNPYWPEKVGGTALE